MTSNETLAGAVSIFFVHDVAAAAALYVEKLGFEVNFLYGNPPFYGSVSRDRARLHLRFVHHPTSKSSPRAKSR